jgi:hypothetical protein
MPSADNEVNSAVVRSNKRIDPSLFGQYTGVETVIYKKEDNGGYTYVLRSETPRTYNAIEASINALDAHLMETDKENSPQCESNFIRIVDDSSTSSGKIMLSGNLTGIMSSKTGKFRKDVEIWRQAATVPPRKRVMADEQTAVLIDPVLKRLSKQLHVDFAMEVRGNDGKRKRQPTRSIYEEAALEAEQRVKRPYVKKSVKPKASATNAESSAEISEIDEEEFNQEDKVKEEGEFISVSNHNKIVDSKDRMIKMQLDMITALQKQIADSTTTATAV